MNKVDEGHIIEVFQFHDGSIKGVKRGSHWVNEDYFNSTMVRLKETNPCHQVFSTSISIPRWFD